MLAKKPATNDLKTRIDFAKKNKEDISGLIEGYDIKGLDLSGTIIKKIVRINEDLRNTTFINAVIGEEGQIANFVGCDMRGCNFRRVVFKGTTWFRNADLRNTTFYGAWLPNVQYQNADLRGINLCEAVLRVGSDTGRNAKLDPQVFLEWAKHLGVELVRDNLNG